MPEKSSNTFTETHLCPVPAALLLCYILKQHTDLAANATQHSRCFSLFSWSSFQVFGAICHHFYYHATTRKCISSVGLEVQDYILHHCLLAYFGQFEINTKLCSPQNLVFKKTAQSWAVAEVLGNH